MKTRLMRAAALALAPLLLSGPSQAETTVTDDEGRSEVLFDVGALHPMPGAQVTHDYCSACHSTMIIAQQGQTREGWDDILVWMVEDMGMGELEPDVRTRILDYLAEYYNPDRPHFPSN